MKNFTFGTKAETLELLRENICSAQVKSSAIFTVSEWSDDAERVSNLIQKQFSDQTVIVRSSAISEDSEYESKAGAYLSIAHVQVNTTPDLHNAVGAVVEVLKEDPENQFFVQEQVQNIKMSGVLFTRDGDTLAPYYIVNYDDESGSHESVTAGSSGNLSTYVRFRQSQNDAAQFHLQQVISAAQEIEKLFNCDHLDIEFAITAAGELFILQVRPIVVKGKPEPQDDDFMQNCLQKVYQKIRKQNAPHPKLYGKRAIYSVMSDWNPAEMIGIRPRKLALSLYKELITDSIWAYQRDNYGYLSLRSFPLLISLLGCPYIDVRASFNSFIPKDLEGNLAGKLVDYYSEQLLQNPSDHDKIEFNLLFSCYYLNLGHKIKRLLNFGFSELELDRIKFALLSLTNRIIGVKDGLFQNDLEKVQGLGQRFEEIAQGELHVIDKIYWLIEDCKRYGTLPFAGLARAGFIGVQMLNSIVEIGIFTPEDRDNFMKSLNTVSNQFSTDLFNYANKTLSKEDILEKYGHLRPGTYDILSQRYDEAFDLYCSTNNVEETKISPPDQASSFVLTDEMRTKLNAKLEEAGISANSEQLLDFIKQAIEGREYGKFVFTKSISHILKLVQLIGDRFDLSIEAMSHVNIRTFLDLYACLTHEDVKTILERDIERNKEAHAVTQAIKLPQLITSEEEIYDFYLTKTEPNYVTSNRVTSIVVVEQDFPNIDLEGKIVLIKSADPGYDWMFSRGIGGLITMYGGINSHMAIRCAELHIPAVIGCGEQNYMLWSKANTIKIDCENHQVTVLA